MEILQKELDPDQLSAAANLDQPLLVLAGPGSGKTRLLTQRIGYILRSVLRKDFKVLALTFTNKAAREMTERLTLMPGYQKERAFVGTFHRFCQELLQSYACYIGRNRRFTILDPDDQHALLAQCLAEVGLTRVKPEGIRNAIERAQRQMLSPEDYAKLLVGKGQSARPAEVYRVYEERERVRWLTSMTCSFCLLHSCETFLQYSVSIRMRLSLSVLMNAKIRRLLSSNL